MAAPAPTPIPVEGKLDHGAYISGDQPGGYFHWTAQAWTENDRPFVSIRKSVESQLLKSPKPIAIVAAYKKVALKKPIDAQAQFRWAYGVYFARKSRLPGVDVVAVVKGVSAGLEQASSFTKSYQYTRLRIFFLLWESKWDNNAPLYLKRCLYRLAKRDTKDYYLKYVFAYKLGEDDVTLPIAEGWDSEYQKAFPRDPKSLFLIASLHEDKFGLFASEKEGRSAIVHYDRYVSIVPQGSPEHTLAQWHIREIKRRTELFRSKGMLKN